MSLPFPTPDAVQDLVDELTDLGLHPHVELRGFLEIVVWVANPRVYASASFRRGRRGFRMLNGGGDLIIDGSHRETVERENLGLLRFIFDKPDFYAELTSDKTVDNALGLAFECPMPTPGLPVDDAVQVPQQVAKMARMMRPPAGSTDPAATVIHTVTIEQAGTRWHVRGDTTLGNSLLVVFTPQRAGGYRTMFLSIDPERSKAVYVGDSLTALINSLTVPPPENPVPVVARAPAPSPPRTKNDQLAVKRNTVIRT